MKFIYVGKPEQDNPAVVNFYGQNFILDEEVEVNDPTRIERLKVSPLFKLVKPVRKKKEPKDV